MWQKVRIFSIEIEIIVSFKGPHTTKPLDFYNLIVERDSTIAISQVIKKESSFWSFDGWFLQFLYITNPIKWEIF